MAKAERVAADVPPTSYGRYYYEHDCGQPYERNEHWLGFFHELAQRIVDDIAPTTVLDAGCAMGFLVEALRERGVEAWGIDVSDYALERVDKSVKDYVSQASLTQPLPRRYDLVTCLEVLEHMPARDAERALTNICAATDQVLFSSSPFDYAEPTHVNVRPPEEWSEMFARQGLLRDVDFDVTALIPWSVLYRRSEIPVPALVRSYERTWWRLKYEARELRQTVLELHRRLDEVDWEEFRRLETTLETTLRERDRQLDEALARVNELEQMKRQLEQLLDTRSGRVLRAYHRVRAALRR
jgi:SAM-dependent methyltransferase